MLVFGLAFALLLVFDILQSRNQYKKEQFSAKAIGMNKESRTAYRGNQLTMLSAFPYPLTMLPFTYKNPFNICAGGLFACNIGWV